MTKANLQTFMSFGAGEHVILSRADYEALIDRADIAAADRVRADIAAGRDEMIPEAFADRLIDGESPVRVYRELRGLTGRQVAEKAGISAAYFSEIEGGKKEGTASTLKKIAEALNVTVDDLI